MRIFRIHILIYLAECGNKVTKWSRNPYPKDMKLTHQFSALSIFDLVDMMKVLFQPETQLQLIAN